jgi:hypothetical protein
MGGRKLRGAMHNNVAVPSERGHEKYERLIAATKNLAALATAVAHPCDETSLKRGAGRGASWNYRPDSRWPKGANSQSGKEWLAMSVAGAPATNAKVAAV